jgi:ABC-2 type transport system ATP-binding protein
VLELKTPDPRKAQRVLAEQPYVKSVAQLGARLHVLLDRQMKAPLEQTQAVMRNAGIDAQMEITRANLEDVFVAATRFKRN